MVKLCIQITLMSVYLLKVSQVATVALLGLLVVVLVGSTGQCRAHRTKCVRRIGSTAISVTTVSHERSRDC